MDSRLCLRGHETGGDGNCYTETGQPALVHKCAGVGVVECQSPTSEAPVVGTFQMRLAHFVLG